jgi:intermediate cleaving peptidase 55
LNSYFIEQENTKNIFKDRRHKLISSLPEKSCILVYNINNLTDEQILYFGIPNNIYMHYLTNDNLDNSILLMSPIGIRVNGKTYNEVLFKYQQNEFEKNWEGTSLSLDDAENILGISKAIDLKNIDFYLDSVLSRCDTLYILPSNYQYSLIQKKDIPTNEDFTNCNYQMNNIQIFTKI